MKTYCVYRSGSEWRKWDLHIHTPFTKLNNNYTGINDEEIWNKFCENIETSDVSVFGITDYFGIENYCRFIEKYHEKYPITKKVFFPNIEFRLEASVNRVAEEVNIHVIFNNEVDIDKIRDFLRAMPTNIQKESIYLSCLKLKDEEIVSAAIDHKKLRPTLIKIFGNDKNFIIGASANNQGLRPDTNSPRKMNISDEIERTCDFIFGSNSNKEYYLKNNRYEFGTKAEKKPVVSGCDAHSFEEIQKYLGKHIEDKGKYITWIKSNPTFNGLRQIIYEPETRVFIQSVKPDLKDSHNIIKEISFSEDGLIFGNQTIYFNQNLNTIIGGKSSGKSLLLQSIAKNIDPQQIERLSEKFNIGNYDLGKVRFDVKWENDDNDDDILADDGGFRGQIRKHRITYIPQLYINYLAEKNNKFELNKLINEILLQDIEFKEFKTSIDIEIQNISNSINDELQKLIDLRNDGVNNSERRKEFGTIEYYVSEIARLVKLLNETRESTTLTDSEIMEYNELIDSLRIEKEKNLSITNKSIAYQNIYKELISNMNSIFGYVSKGIKIKGSIEKYTNRVDDEYGNISQYLVKLIDNINKSIKIYSEDIKNMKLDEIISNSNTRILNIGKEIEKYAEKISKQSNMAELTKQIEKMKSAKKEVESLEMRYKEILDEYRITKKHINVLMKERNDKYIEIIEYINLKKGNIGAEIKLSSSLVYRLEDFELYNQVDKRSVNSNPTFLSIIKENETVNYELLPNLFEQIIRVENTQIKMVDDTQNMLLRQKIDVSEIFKGLVKDKININYNVTYRDDDLLKMSPGKKGTVLLILFLQISSAVYPILIDQPEDNLDNRTIYDLLCKIIKDKKNERQIIIVTHNANLVVTTDSENIIVANQEGQDPGKNKSKYKFEYINGALEVSFNDAQNEGILFQNGIKQHVCDILEGGDEAFKQRERKYQFE